jgi:serine/threonine protein phosphatase PrpC
VLASDGLVEGLEPAELAELAGADQPERAAALLVQRSQDNLRTGRGAHQEGQRPTSDNMTAVVVVLGGLE